MLYGCIVEYNMTYYTRPGIESQCGRLVGSWHSACGRGCCRLLHQSHRGVGSEEGSEDTCTLAVLVVVHIHRQTYKSHFCSSFLLLLRLTLSTRNINSLKCNDDTNNCRHFKYGTLRSCCHASHTTYLPHGPLYMTVTSDLSMQLVLWRWHWES